MALYVCMCVCVCIYTHTNKYTDIRIHIPTCSMNSIGFTTALMILVTSGRNQNIAKNFKMRILFQKGNEPIKQNA